MTAAQKPIKTFLLILAVLIALPLAFLQCKTRERKPAAPLDAPEVLQAVSSNKTKLLIIGIDGASWSVVDDLVKKGRLPNLQKLIAAGASGVMNSEPPMISPSLWTSFATGVPRKVHRIDNFTFKPVKSYEPQAMDSRVRAAPALWEILSHYQKKVGVVNWNGAWPAEPVNGVFVADGANPDNLSAQSVYPPEWAGRLKKIPLPRAEWFEKNYSRWSHALPPKAYAEDTFVAGAATEILKSEQPDLMMVYFRNIDVVSHVFWKYSFPESPGHKFEVIDQDRERWGDLIPAYYQLTDELIGKIIAAAPDYDVIIISDHGQGATYQPNNIFLELNNLLHELGLLQFQQDTCVDILKRMSDQGVYKSDAPARDIFFDCELLHHRAQPDLLQSKNRISPDKMEQAKPYLEKLYDALAHPELAGKIDFKRTELYNVDDFHKDQRGIFLNLKGRDPEGVVPFKDFQTQGNIYIRQLSELQNENGVKLFKVIQPNPGKKQPVVSGPIDPPDILVEFNPAAMTGQWVLRNKDDKRPIFESSVLWSYQDVSGDHTPEGVVIISGPGCSAGAKISIQVNDVAPTLLWRFDAPVGLDMPGRILYQAFTGQRITVKYVKSYLGEIKVLVKYQARGMTEDDKQRMRAIGYTK
jgi:predicted AlkP superfamily phosphohydrolase/phosphomutase